VLDAVVHRQWLGTPGAGRSSTQERRPRQRAVTVTTPRLPARDRRPLRRFPRRDETSNVNYGCGVTNPCDRGSRPGRF
jgi:hypothetical protein